MIVYTIVFSRDYFNLFLGKCYNVPEDFLIHRQSKTTDETSHIEVKKGEPKKLNPESIHNIPAVLHYETKQALLRELSRNDRGLGVTEKSAKPEEIDENESNNHFFYSNAPIMEFNINGESGSVGQTPRK